MFFRHEAYDISPFRGTGAAVKPIRNENLMLVTITGREDIGTLKRLVGISEDVGNDYNSLSSVLGPDCTALETS